MKLLVLIVAIAIVLAIVSLRRRDKSRTNSKSNNLPDKKAGKARVQARSPYRATSIVYDEKACSADRELGGKRFLDVHLEACICLAQGLVDLGLMKGRPEDAVAAGAHAMFFPCGVGHLMGLDVHDMEDLGDIVGYAPGEERSTQFGLAALRMARKLEPGFVFTIEPGIYLADEGIGIRIEDDVLITAGGCEVLTEAIPRTVEAIETRMRRA